MAQDTYEVIADEYTIHKQVGEIRDPVTDQVTGIQQGQGKVYFKGDVVPASEISPLLIQALEDEDHPSHEYVSKRLKKSGDEPKEALSPRLGAPFAGYDEMDEADVLKAMANLPSAAIQRIKEYEAAHEDRASIVRFNIGFGESPELRQTGAVSSDHQEGNTDKKVAELKTREVPEEGVVEPGEGVTGTGDGVIPHESDEDEGSRRGSRQRRSRRTRQASGGESDSGESSGS